MERIIGEHFELKGMVKLTNGAPQMSGLGGSAACYVAGIKAIEPEWDKGQIAKFAIHLERNVMNIIGGKQDQYASAYGGLNYIRFENNRVKMEAVKIPADFTELWLLVYMGPRKVWGQDILKNQLSQDNIDNFKLQKAIAKELAQALRSDKLREFGNLLNAAWTIKKQFSPLISTDTINEFYNYCISNGAIGGKLTGAGGGGFMVLMEDPDKRGELRLALSNKEINYTNVKFDIEGACIRK